MLFCAGRVNNSNLLLKTEINLEFLISSSKLNQSLNVEEKKVLQAICSTMEDWNMAISCSYCLITFWN